jgi:Glycosyltransferase family 9 (heptosyltransferase)
VPGGRTVLATLSPPRRERPTLLVLRALWLGDLLTIVPCLRALAGAFAGWRRLLAAPAVLTPLVELAEVGFEVVDAAPIRPLPATCAAPDVAVNLHGRGPQSHRVLLAMEPARLIAFRHPDVLETDGAPVWAPGEHEVVRWCRLLRESGIRADPTSLRLRRPQSSDARFEGATVLHAGAKAIERRWPAERWAAVAHAERDAGRQVVLTGSPEELELAREIAEVAGIADEAVLAGRTRLDELAVLVARAGRVISGDTGVAHLATAFGTPSVILFGSVPPHEWGPLVDTDIHRAIWKGPAGPADAAEPHPALLQVRPEEVVSAAGSLPGRS